MLQTTPVGRVGISVCRRSNRDATDKDSMSRDDTAQLILTMANRIHDQPCAPPAETNDVNELITCTFIFV
jgi:hypothetical protein